MMFNQVKRIWFVLFLGSLTTLVACDWFATPTPTPGDTSAKEVVEPVLETGVSVEDDLKSQLQVLEKEMNVGFNPFGVKNSSTSPTNVVTRSYLFVNEQSDEFVVHLASDEEEKLEQFEEDAKLAIAVYPVDTVIRPELDSQQMRWGSIVTQLIFNSNNVANTVDEILADGLYFDEDIVEKRIAQLAPLGVNFDYTELRRDVANQPAGEKRAQRVREIGCGMERWLQKSGGACNDKLLQNHRFVPLTSSLVAANDMATLRALFPDDIEINIEVHKLRSMSIILGENPFVLGMLLDPRVPNPYGQDGGYRYYDCDADWTYSSVKIYSSTTSNTKIHTTLSGPTIHDPSPQQVGQSKTSPNLRANPIPSPADWNDIVWNRNKNKGNINYWYADSQTASPRVYNTYVWASRGSGYFTLASTTETYKPSCESD